MRFVGLSLLAATCSLPEARFARGNRVLRDLVRFNPKEVDNSKKADMGSECGKASNPILQEVLGNESDFPFDVATVAITSQQIDEVDFTVSQVLIEDGVPMMAVSYRSLDGHDMCSMEALDDGSLITFNTGKEIKAQCRHGYADVGVYAYIGPMEDFSVNECEACSVPNNNYIGYLVSLPCVPVCAKEGIECISKPTVYLADVGQEQKCIYEESPIITEATGMKTDSVEFRISNTWPEDFAALSVYSKNVDGEPECTFLENMEGFSTSAPIEAFCDRGVANVTVLIHSEGIGHFATSVPKECTNTRREKLGTCSFSFVVPCTLGEICSTTKALVTQGVVNCAQLLNPTLQRIIGKKEYPFHNGIVSIADKKIDEVDFTVSQLWNRKGIQMFAVYFKKDEEEDICVTERSQYNRMIPYKTKKRYTAKCHKGFTQIVVYAYVGPTETFAIKENNACSVPNDNYVAYFVQLSCTPMCKTETPDCLDVPTVTFSDIDEEETCMYQKTPIVLKKANMKANWVQFSIENTWPGKISALWVNFLNKEGKNRCEKLHNLDAFRETTIFEAFCPDGFADVSVHITTSEINHRSKIIQDSCMIPEETQICSYEFKIPCKKEPDCFKLSDSEKKEDAENALQKELTKGIHVQRKAI
ncbi:unnamed protein product, partial [Pseudo-nitzschia multistriata]